VLTLFTFTANVCEADEPQELIAETLMFPLELLTVVVIEFVEDAPIHKPGKVHV
jgi:hypothetical protein